ncbi:hypothetical protein Glove_709g33 [Diversispora epigaea]|uniref:Uncharacterized protein n=1 Tax=Diversispora epigaea TaxID=1348612 RepID=A0A397G2C4_9GLOM|nr:hypothetical protein Glove_709g33 [Diversispora epigaea]
MEALVFDYVIEYIIDDLFSLSENLRFTVVDDKRNPYKNSIYTCGPIDRNYSVVTCRQCPFWRNVRDSQLLWPGLEMEWFILGSGFFRGNVIIQSEAFQVQSFVLEVKGGSDCPLA